MPIGTIERSLEPGLSMPELPEVENIVRDLRPKLCGMVIAGAEMTDRTAFAGPDRVFIETLANKTIEEISRKGKCIVFRLSGSCELIIHLGMTGQLLYGEKGGEMNGQSVAYTRVLFHMRGGDQELRFADMRRFGWVDVRRCEEDSPNAYVARLGPDAMSVNFKDFRTCFVNRKGRIKGLLLNQSIMSGLGNIYVDESLHAAGIHPGRRADTLSDGEMRRLHGAIRKVLAKAIDSGGSTIRDYLLPDGRQGGFQREHRVYQRQGKPCKRCGTPVVRITVAGRGTYFCPRCQRMKP